MEKEKAIQFLIDDHKELKIVLESLELEDFVTFRVLGTWKIKDVVAHLSAWNIELRTAIDKLLSNEEIWFIGEHDEDYFNKIQVLRRKSYTVEEVLDEWEKTFNDLVERMKKLTEEEWNFSSKFEWKNGVSVSTKSLFGYRKRGKGHEGYHALLIEEYFDADYCSCERY